MMSLQIKRLGDVCEYDKAQGVYSNLPYVGLEHIESNTARFIGSLKNQSVKSSTFKFSNEHVLYGRLRPYLNKALAPNFNGHCSTEIFPIKPGPQLLREYLLYWLISDDTKERINSTSTGARMPRADMNEVLDFDIPVPPLPEQQRIVRILDEAFAGIAVARANAEKNLQNAREVFESYLHTIFSQPKHGWNERKLGELCEIARGGSPRPIQQFLTKDPEGINWIKISDATASGKYIYKTEEKIIPDGVRRSRMVHDGDFLLSNSMSFGRPYIMRTSGCIHDGWLVLSNYSDHLDQDFLYYVLGSKFIYQQFDRLAAGSTVRNLNIELASRVIMPVPPLTEQRSIAKQLDTVSKEIQQLEAVFRKKLSTLDELKQSLLHQAFSGEL